MKNYTFVHASVCILEICQMTKSGGRGRKAAQPYIPPTQSQEPHQLVSEGCDGFGLCCVPTPGGSGGNSE